MYEKDIEQIRSNIGSQTEINAEVSALNNDIRGQTERKKSLPNVVDLPLAQLLPSASL